jgi:hypothetical protein
MLPRPILHGPSSILIDDLDFAVSHQVMCVTLHQMERCQSLTYQFFTTLAPRPKPSVTLGQVGQPLLPSPCDLYGALTPLNDKVDTHGLTPVALGN